MQELRGKVKIKRKTVLDAIKYNHLVSGEWINTVILDRLTKANYSQCTACLVGSLFKRHFKPITKADYFALDDIMSNNISTVTYAKQDSYASYNHIITVTPSCYQYKLKDLATLTNKKYYLHALSYLFEGQISLQAQETDMVHNKVKLTKQRIKYMLDWVKENIPVEFEVNLG